MTDLRELVARAIAKCVDHEVNSQDYLRAADAAIAATKLQREIYVLRDGEFTTEMEPVPETTDGRPCCTLCETPLDIPGRPWTQSCGGDCLACMADAGDPECVAGMAGAVNLPPGWRAVPEEPTGEMMEAGRAAFRSYCLRYMEGHPAVWTAMVEATPSPAPQNGGTE